MTAAALVVFALGSIAARPVDQPDPPPAQPCAPDCVPRQLLVRSEARSRKRLALARTAQRLTLRTRRVLRYVLKHPPYGESPDEAAFLCIHRFEGSWTDPSAPFYGGVQMDYSFQRSYGPEFLAHYGTADHWPIAVQIAVAIKAKFSRGYHPWPNTARYCGLLP